jgi:hypothetical protein
MNIMQPPYLLRPIQKGQIPSANYLAKLARAINQMNAGTFPARQIFLQVVPAVLATIEPAIFELDGGGSVLTLTVPTTAGACVLITRPCTITQWTIWADQSDSATVDIWRANGAVPTSANSIVGSGNKPALSSQQINSANPNSSWTSVALVPGDLIGFGLTVAPATATRITVALTLQG